MPERFFPAAFVFLWASAFIAAKFGVSAAGPFSFLCVRFTMVALLFGLLALWLRPAMPGRGHIPSIVLAGVLMYGVYLGGIFYAISLGTPTGVGALVTALQPLLTCFLALWLLKEDIRPMQWLGIALGMAGVAAVVWPKLGGVVPPVGLASCVAAVIAISFGTIIQKRYSDSIDLLAGNMIQAAAAAAFFGLLLALVEPYSLEWTLEVTLAMAWSTLAVSLGAITILMLLIRRGQMAATSSLFFMAPPVAGVMGHLAFDEAFGALEIAGFAIACTGVWMVVRNQQGRE